MAKPTPPPLPDAWPVQPNESTFQREVAARAEEDRRRKDAAARGRAEMKRESRFFAIVRRMVLTVGSVLFGMLLSSFLREMNREIPLGVATPGERFLGEMHAERLFRKYDAGTHSEEEFIWLYRWANARRLSTPELVFTSDARDPRDAELEFADWQGQHGAIDGLHNEAVFLINRWFSSLEVGKVEQIDQAVHDPEVNEHVRVICRDNTNGDGSGYEVKVRIVATAEWAFMLLPYYLEIDD